MTIWEWAAITGIIAVTLTIALPFYKRAANAARAVACTSNLSYQYRMFGMYMQDYDGTYPPLPQTGDLTVAMRPVQASTDAWTGRLDSYREARKSEKNDPFVCPAADPDVMTYAYNAALGARIFPQYDPKGMSASDADIRTPAQTYLIWDTANRAGANALVGYRYFSGARRDGAYRVGDLVLPSRAIKIEWMKPRHNNESAGLFCDGHIGRLSDTSVRGEETSNPFDPLASVSE